MAYDDHVEEHFRETTESEARAEAEALELHVDIKRNRTQTDPPHDFFNVMITGTRGEWPETPGSEADLRILLRGIKAGAEMMGGRVTMSEIPDQPFMV